MEIKNMKRIIRSDFCCCDCKGINDDYMLRHEVWEKVAGLKILLCLTCVQARLQRPLTRDDFDFSIPVNRTVLMGIRIGTQGY